MEEKIIVSNDDDGKRRVDDDGDVPARNASNEPSSRDESKQDGGLVTSSVLTADERNELAAKLVKAEIMGNTELAAELKSRLERAREAAAAPERVVLTVTDGRGFTQPLAAPAAPSNHADTSRGKGGKKVKTHDDSGKRVRYFADDDRFTLQEMFEREKRNTAEDQNEMFARLAGKKIGDDDSARDMDDVFEETASRGGGAREAARADERARARAIGQHQRATRAHDNCSGVSTANPAQASRCCNRQQGVPLPATA
ncbi:CWF19-like protein 2 homolog [Nilaparvata lugens]|uniref:CWF19-like protein 2 homolog n=1 Tax=Nilaparvata lugens TaxID=108931 RepID=UPI00193CFD9C|nr:CWF19-like protein 2 homolog [Nilaparvata lugens]